MLDAIEDATIERIKTTLAAAATHIDVQKGIEGIPVPATYVSIEEGTFEKVASDTFNQEITLYIDIVFSNLQNESQRRRGIYPIMEGIVQSLLLQRLGLKIAPLQPKSFRNVTTPEQKGNGLIVFTLAMTTKYTIKKLDEEAINDLIIIGLEYYLKPGDDIKDAEDIITTLEI